VDGRLPVTDHEREASMVRDLEVIRQPERHRDRLPWGDDIPFEGIERPADTGELRSELNATKIEVSGVGELDRHMSAVVELDPLELVPFERRHLAPNRDRRDNEGLAVEAGDLERERRCLSDRVIVGGMRRDADAELGGLARIEDCPGRRQCDDERIVAGVVGPADAQPECTVWSDVADFQGDFPRFAVEGLDRVGDGVELQERRVKLHLGLHRLEPSVLRAPEEKGAVVMAEASSGEATADPGPTLAAQEDPRGSEFIISLTEAHFRRA